MRPSSQLALVAFELAGAPPGDVDAARKAWLTPWARWAKDGDGVADILAAVPKSFVSWVAARAGLGELFCMQPQPERGAARGRASRAEWNKLLVSMLDLPGCMQ